MLTNPGVNTGAIALRARPLKQPPRKGYNTTVVCAQSGGNQNFKYVWLGLVDIRAEQPKDWTAVHAVNASAFPTPAEANLVDTLRQEAEPIVSIVAEEKGRVVGHIMFSPVTLSGHPHLKIMGLAPLAVLPENQRKGIGSGLAEAGLQRCRELGFGAVVVLGHREYLVDTLRQEAEPIVSIVAEEKGRVVGHIMFSPVTLSGHPHLKIMGLAPLAVLPENQRKGIGSGLAEAGLQRCRELGFGAVVVLGHREYYPRFGFVPSQHFGIGCEYEVPQETFMVVELEHGLLNGVSGTIEYHEAFRDF